ncbi:hypothetical protein KFK09_008513 [Dendrobium nobile]|uniref:Uncharacterized protein n=1 Tax=Dendrobium nobile TaxID=94219 RepID=A0A8T3BNA9_DENNO|nr:hypothetical protein KFK09_008513 [Dendrobium nobile]
MLVGLNPVVIKRLESSPPMGKNGRQSSILPTHIQNNLDGLTINQILDHSEKNQSASCHSIYNGTHQTGDVARSNSAPHGVDICTK